MTQLDHPDDLALIKKLACYEHWMCQCLYTLAPRLKVIASQPGLILKPLESARVQRTDAQKLSVLLLFTVVTEGA